MARCDIVPDFVGGFNNWSSRNTAFLMWVQDQRAKTSGFGYDLAYAKSGQKITGHVQDDEGTATFEATVEGKQLQVRKKYLEGASPFVEGGVYLASGEISEDRKTVNGEWKEEFGKDNGPFVLEKYGEFRDRTNKLPFIDKAMAYHGVSALMDTHREFHRLLDERSQPLKAPQIRQV